MWPEAALFKSFQWARCARRADVFSVRSVSLWFLCYLDMKTGQLELRSTYSVVDPSTISMILLCP